MLGGAGIAAAAVPAHADDAEDAPKNVIVMIGDGMGYNHIDLLNARTTGETHWQVQRGGDRKVIPSGQNTEPSEGWQAWNHLGMSTHWHDGPVYDPAKSWTDWEWNKLDPTDSAAAGTAMATGVKTYNAGLGVDYEGDVVENVAERAQSLGKSAGVVSSVPYSHATPAAYSSHNESRSDYHGIAREQIDGDLEVVIGAAHPYFSDDSEPLEQGDFTYIAEEDWERVSNGETDRAFLETTEDFEALTTGETPDKVFGTPQVASTLQQARTEGAPLNDVVGLPTLTEGALNVLDDSEEGFFLMVEGGAIDWTGHANQSERNLEEVRDFDDAVTSVIDWVETNSSWDETLVVVTADHETGYLYGATEGDFSSIIPAGEGADEAELPQHSWNSDNHTNQLVGFFYQGAGADQVTALGTQRDTIRGRYFDNTDLAQWLLNDAWAVSEEPEPGDEDADADGGSDEADESDADGSEDSSPGDEEGAEAGDENAEGSAESGDGAEDGAGEGSTESGDGADDQGAAGSDGGDAAKPGDLEATGGSPALPLGLGAAALLALGGILVALRVRARRATA